LNVILRPSVSVPEGRKGKGLEDSENSVLYSEGMSSSSDSDGESSSDEGDGIKQRNEIDDYLLGFGLKKKISKNSIMPKFAKGSQQMKDHMAKLRAMKGKGVKGSKSKTHKGEEDYTTKKGDKYYHQKGHLVEGDPYMEGGAVLLPRVILQINWI